MNELPADASSRAVALNAEAEQLIDRGQPVAAEAVLREALALTPGYAEAWNNLGRALNNLRRLPDAEAALLRAVAANPGMPQGWSISPTCGAPLVDRQTPRPTADEGSGSCRGPRRRCSGFSPPCG